MPWLRRLGAWPTPIAGVAAARLGAPREYAPGRTIDQLLVGQQATMTRTVSQADIDAFARISGDMNPVHTDAEWAAKSVVKGRISHGMLTAGLISATIGRQLPGPGTIYVSLSRRWIAPVRAGDTLACTVTVKDLVPDTQRAILSTLVTRDNQEVLTGEAVVLAPPAVA